MLWVLFWKNFFYSEGGEALGQLPREVVDVSLDTFQAKLEFSWVLGDLICWKLLLLIAGGWTGVAFKDPFSPKLFCDSVEQKGDKSLMSTILCLVLMHNSRGLAAKDTEQTFLGWQVTKSYFSTSGFNPQGL